MEIIASCGIVGWFFKSRWVKKVIVKRYIVKPKRFDLQMTTKLGIIKRPSIFKIWDERVDDEIGVKPFILVEGYQGTGKSFLAKKYIEEQSLKRPTLYISLREVEPTNWQKIISNQIHLYRDHILVRSQDQYDYVDECFISCFAELATSRCWWFSPDTGLLRSQDH